MRTYVREIVFGTTLSIIFAGLLIRFATHESPALLTISFAVLTLLIGIVTFIWQTVNKYRDTEAGAPSEDEFTKLARVYAGNRAFLYSMYLWLLIFIFNSSFTKNETMLGVGILGYLFIYGVSLWSFKATGFFNEE